MIKLFTKLEKFIISIRFIKNRELHDKIELDVVPNIYTLTTEEKLLLLDKECELSIKERNQYLSELLNLTNSIFEENGFFDQDSKKIRYFRENYSTNLTQSIDEIKKSLPFVIEYGIESFAGIARSAFASKAIVLSFQETKIWSQKELDCFMNLLYTTGRMITKDSQSLSEGDFIRKYQHLRPSTYDICMPRYSNLEIKKLAVTSSNIEQDSREQIIEKLAIKIPNTFDGNGLSKKEFVKKLLDAIEMRELAKFEFTKWISDSLETIASHFEKKGIDRESCSYLQIEDILWETDKSRLLAVIEKNKAEYMIKNTALVPEVTTESTELFSFFEVRKQGNYIIDNVVSGELISLNSKNLSASLNSKIVLLESADPGYDFIFLDEVAGFITKYGGPNSHMAIRAFELGIPAVLGVGESTFRNLQKQKMLTIDGRQQVIKCM